MHSCLNAWINDCHLPYVKDSLSSSNSHIVQLFTMHHSRLSLYIVDQHFFQKQNFRKVPFRRLLCVPPCLCAELLSHVQLFATLWDCSPLVSSVPDFPGKDTGVGCHVLQQRIFPTQGSNPHFLQLLNCREILYAEPLRRHQRRFTCHQLSLILIQHIMQECLSFVTT